MGRCPYVRLAKGVVLVTYTSTDIDCMARTIYGEARGEVWEGKVAVAWVIRNRAEKGGWWGDTIETVTRYPWQFSCWNKNDPNRERLLTTDPSDAYFVQCLAATAAVLGGIEPDPTGGACHYHTAAVQPTWAGLKFDEDGKVTKWREPDVKIGHHLFYRGVD